tara:strand:- start:607 stop:1317 length:711 start_codon:yes stop_codon:yes gene_type:complete
MKTFIITFLSILDQFIQKKNLIIFQKFFKKKINVYIDIGSHKGEMINVIKKNFNVKNIFAFEPNKDCHKFLKLIKHKNIKVFKYALSNKTGKDELKIGYISAMSTLNKINDYSFYTFIKKIVISIFFFKSKIYKKKIQIEKKTFKKIFDKYNYKTLDLVKIDTEGHELNVLIGMGSYLKKVNVLLLEYHYDNSLIKDYNFDDLNLFLKKKNFELISKNKMLMRKGYEIIYKNQKII